MRYGRVYKRKPYPYAVNDLVSTVYLVGSGPSGADLLSLRGYKLLQEADLIVYDALVDESIHQLFAPSAERIYVGKRAGQHALKQSEINQVLVSSAQSGRYRSIVRLKGGDPFVFGRGGEEMIALREAQIAYEVVPGITAGIAAPAYMGIPVTHRGLSRSVTLITAFTQEGGLPPLDWEAYTRLEGTLVFYMSMRVVPDIAKALIGAGMPADTTAAIISEGTRATQRLVSASLSQYRAESYDYESFTPGLFVVGDVVSFAEDYAWYSPSPLAGKSVLITRSEGQTSLLTELFGAEGAVAKVLPSFEIEYCTADVERAIDDGWSDTILALSSPNAVHAFVSYLHSMGRDGRMLSAFEAIAVIGPATRKALEGYGIRADLMASLHTAEGLAECIARESKARRVLHPTSDLARPQFADILASYGISTDTLVVYRNKPIHYERAELLQLLSDGLEWISFCSSSAVRNFIDLVRSYDLEPQLRHIRLATIGPLTAETIRSYGYEVTAQATSPELKALVEAMKASYSAK